MTIVKTIITRSSSVRHRRYVGLLTKRALQDNRLRRIQRGIDALNDRVREEGIDRVFPPPVERTPDRRPLPYVTSSGTSVRHRTADEDSDGTDSDGTDDSTPISRLRIWGPTVSSTPSPGSSISTGKLL